MPQEESVLRLGRDEALEAARLWQECGRRARVRVQGAGRRDERADGLRGPADVWREPQRAQRRQGDSRNGYRPRSLKDRRWRRGARETQVRHGTYYPEGMLARWSRVDTSVAAIVQEMYVCGVSTRKVERVASRLAYPRCRARRSRDSAPSSTPRWRSSAAATCRARRAATCGSTPPT